MTPYLLMLQQVILVNYLDLDKIDLKVCIQDVLFQPQLSDQGYLLVSFRTLS